MVLAACPIGLSRSLSRCPSFGNPSSQWTMWACNDRHWWENQNTHLGKIRKTFTDDAKIISMLPLSFNMPLLDKTRPRWADWIMKQTRNITFTYKNGVLNRQFWVWWLIKTEFWTVNFESDEFWWRLAPKAPALHYIAGVSSIMLRKYTINNQIIRNKLRLQQRMTSLSFRHLIVSALSMRYLHSNRPSAATATEVTPQLRSSMI